MLKYRADRCGPIRANGSQPWFTDWMGGPSLAKIDNCPLAIAGDNPRGTVYITGEPDTFFSQPAIVSIKGCRVRGFITSDEAGFSFHPQYY